MRSSASRAPPRGASGGSCLWRPSHPLLKFPGLHNSTLGAPAPPNSQDERKRGVNVTPRVWNRFMMAPLPATWKTELSMELFAIRFTIFNNFCCGFFSVLQWKKEPNPLREADRTETLWCFSSSSIKQKLARLTECKSLSWSSSGKMDRDVLNKVVVPPL